MQDAWDFVTEDGARLRDVVERVSEDATPFPAWISEKLELHEVAKNHAVRDSRLNQTFAYQIISGSRHASRDKLVQLAFGMRLDVHEACELLERGGVNPLSPACRRDVVIAYCLHRGYDISTCDDYLWGLHEETVLPGGAARHDLAGG